MLGRCSLTKFLRPELSQKFIKSALLVGHKLCRDVSLIEHKFCRIVLLAGHEFYRVHCWLDMNFSECVVGWA